MNPQITLREAISTFDALNSNSFSNRDLSSKAQAFFRCHDIAHVIFGCDTSVFGEGKVKVWTLFGTTLGFWKHFKGYSEVNAFSLFKEYSWIHVLKNLGNVILVSPITIVRARQMSKPWPWSSHESYLDVSLLAIREEFNIKLT